MADIFYDNGSVFFIMETGGLPPTPYWKDFIRIGATAETIESDNNGNWLFADEDGKGTLDEARSVQGDAEAQAMAANVLYGVGAAGALAGAWLLLTSDSAAGLELGALQAGVGPGGAVTLRGSWP